jgi:AAA ATPase domain
LPAPHAGAADGPSFGAADGPSFGAADGPSVAGTVGPSAVTADEPSDAGAFGPFPEPVGWVVGAGRPVAGQAPAQPGQGGVGTNAADREIFVGRVAELAALRRAAAAAAGPGSDAGLLPDPAGGIALVTGEAGAGKSSLLGRLRQELTAHGWLVVIGRCRDGEGAPPAWAWAEALRALAVPAPPADPTALTALLSDDPVEPIGADASTGRFRLHQAVCGWLRSAATSRSLAVLLDDLHAADAETLALLGTAAIELAGSPVLLVAAYRPPETVLGPAEPLVELLSVLARRSPTRIPVAGLAPADVATLVETVCGPGVEPGILAALAERSGGNPFYVRESARLLASEGALVATSEVPEGVRDVLRRRLARLPAPAVAVLRLAAVVGRESDVDVLIGAADVDEAGVLDGLDAGIIAGLLTEPTAGRVRFVHALVRDTLYSDLSGLRRRRWHARVAAELRERRPHDLSGLAHHYVQASTADTAAIAVDYCVRAADAAQGRYAHDVSADLLTRALSTLDLIAGVADAERVDLLGRLVRAQIRAGDITAARATRARAVDVAENRSDADLLLTAFVSWTEPTPWQIHPYGVIDETAVGHLTALLARTDLPPTQRCQLIAALIAELEGEGDPRMDGLADEGLAMAAGLSDHRLTLMLLATKTKESATTLDPVVWARLGTELIALGTEHDLVAYRWLGEYLQAKVPTVDGDVVQLRERLTRAASTAERYRLIEPMSLTGTAAAMLAHIRGDFDGANRGYLDVADTMLRHGSLHAMAFRSMALFTVALSEGRVTEFAPTARLMYDQFGPIVADTLSIVVAAEGNLAEARKLHALASPPRPDYFWMLFATLRALAVLAIGAVDEAEELRTALLPYAGELAGASTLSLATRPVALTLGDLSGLLGRADEATAHYRHAVDVARRWGAPHWVAQAESHLR